MTLERQIDYLEKCLMSVNEQADPDRAAVLIKERRKVLRKIQTQADIDHEQMQNSKKQQEGERGEVSELQVVAGEIIKTREFGTEMDDFPIYLEELNGGPLTLEINM